MEPELVLEGPAELFPGRLEVIELGARAGRRPALGQLGDVLGFLGKLLSDALAFLADALKIPLDAIGTGASAVIDAIAGVIEKVPFIGGFVAQIFTIGKVLINVGLKLPEMVLRAFSNVLGAFVKMPEKQQKTLVEGAVGKIMSMARDQGREEEVAKVIRENPPTVGGAPLEGAAAETSPALKAAVGIALPAAITAGSALLG